MTRAPVRRLVVVSHVHHYLSKGRLYAYAPYVREIDIWAGLFPEVRIAAPCRCAPPPDDCLPFARSNIRIEPQPESGGTRWSAKLLQALMLPRLAWGLAKAMRRADAIHVRCPGNLGLIGAVLAPLFSRRIVAKYAGQWTRYPGEPLTFRLQRALLRSRWWRGPVTVYGHTPGKPGHVVPFFSAALTDSQLARARAAAHRRIPGAVLYVGRLSREKNVDVLLEAIGELCAEGRRIACDIVGDGPERRRLEARAQALNGSVRFHGAVEPDRVLDFYECADVLVLPSESEGWPKAVVEAMAFGVLCVTSNRGLLPEMLAGRGLLVPSRDRAALAAALRGILEDRAAYEPYRDRAAEWARRYSLEALRDALGELLAAHWFAR